MMSAVLTDAMAPAIVALARKLLIALWRLVREGVVRDGVVLRPAQ
jgi:transposase